MIDVGVLVQEILDGNADPIEGMGALKMLKKQIEDGMKAIEPDVFASADKYGAKTFEHAGFTITLKDGSKRFNYSKVTEWATAKESLSKAEAKYKAAWMLADKGTSPVDADTGEVLELPVVTYTKPSISMTVIR